MICVEASCRLLITPVYFTCLLQCTTDCHANGGSFSPHVACVIPTIIRNIVDIVDKSAPLTSNDKKSFISIKPVYEIRDVGLIGFGNGNVA